MDTQYAAPTDTAFTSYAEFYRNSAYARFDQEHRSGGTFGVQLLQATQDPFDLVDAPVPEMVFAWERNGGGRTIVDIGDGAQAVEHNPQDTFYITPAHTTAHCDVTYATDIVAAAIPEDKVVLLLEEHGLSLGALGQFYGRVQPAPRAIKALEKLWLCANALGPSAGLFCDGATLHFLATVADATSMSPLGFARPDDKRVSRAIDYIEAHLGEPLTVGELAGIAALSPSQFSRVFKATTGQAVWAFVQQRRIARARGMLLHCATPICQIAFECGFANQNHMTNLFRRHLGTTPGAMRKSN